LPEKQELCAVFLESLSEISCKFSVAPSDVIHKKTNNRGNMKKRQRDVTSEVTQLKDVLTCYWRAELAAQPKVRDEAAESRPKQGITAPRPRWSRLH
jgi:hypothetical protein